MAAHCWQYRDIYREEDGVGDMQLQRTVEALCNELDRAAVKQRREERAAFARQPPNLAPARKSMQSTQATLHCSRQGAASTVQSKSG